MEMLAPLIQNEIRALLHNMLEDIFKNNISGNNDQTVGPKRKYNRVEEVLEMVKEASSGLTTTQICSKTGIETALERKKMEVVLRYLEKKALVRTEGNLCMAV